MRINKQIEFHFNKATELALAEVRRLARKILQEHACLDEFIMAMGMATFSVKGEVESLGTDERAYLRPLDEFLEVWDDELKLTGEPMRFTAYGPEINEW
jgi:hypothetical protein